MPLRLRVSANHHKNRSSPLCVILISIFQKKEPLASRVLGFPRSPSFDKVVFQFDVIRSYLFTVDFGVNFGLTWGELLINTPLSINTA